MPTDTKRGLKRILGDFDHDNIGTAAGNGIRWLNSSDAGDTAFDIVAATQGGVARGATAATDDNLIELSHGLVAWRGQDGVLGMEVRAQLDVVTNVAFNIGFNDDALEDSNTLPVELATVTFTRNANDFVGFVFDVDATNDDVHVIWTDDSALTSTAIASLRYTGLGPLAGIYASYRIELQDAGAGNQLVTLLTFVRKTAAAAAATGHQKRFSTLDRDQLLVPYTGWENRTATAHQVTIDSIDIWASKPD